jgi:YgiT-type zinc finger domain-containing protein
MKSCVICKSGEVSAGTTTLTVERGKMTVVLKEIPARVCDSCGEAYFDEAITSRIERIVEQLEHSGVEVVVQEFVAA